MRSSVALGGAVILVGATGCGSKAAALDPPRIVPWSAVGSVRIGFSAERIRRIYGAPTKSQTLHLPVGTRYSNRAVRSESYRVRGGKLIVTYVDDVAKSIYTDSPRYRTPDGIGVGVKVARGPCRPNASGSCRYTWRSFEFDECGSAWGMSSAHLDVEIYMDRQLFVHPRGRIAGIEFGDPNVVLYCF